MAEDEAEEVAQQVFMHAIKAIAGYRGEASLFTWLCQIARFEISAFYRKRERRVPTVAIEDELELQSDLESFIEADELAPESTAIRDQAQAIVEIILDHLPADYGRILEWKYLEGYSVEEIASRLGVSLVSVQSKLARARDAFRVQYASATTRIRELAGTSPESGAPAGAGVNRE
jgi:RNA polymerase sigma-70 factor (ECF subfamily)